MEAFGFGNPGAALAKDGAIDFPALRTRNPWIGMPALLSFAGALALVALIAPRYGVDTILLAALAGLVLSAGVAIARAPLAAAPNPEAAAKPVFAAASSSWSLPAAQTKRADAAELPPIDGIVDAFADAAGLRMTLLVTGEASPAALAVAVAAARRLAKRGPAALLDLGATQPWLADVLDRRRQPEALFGLTDVLHGRASFDQALHRDLSTSLDILPAGKGEIEQSMLAPVLESLAKTYDYVVVHASDWRAPPGCAAIGAVDAAIVCAPAGRVEAARQRLREAFADLTVLTEGIAVGVVRAPFARAA